MIIIVFVIFSTLRSYYNNGCYNTTKFANIPR